MLLCNSPCNSQDVLFFFYHHAAVFWICTVLCAHRVFCFNFYLGMLCCAMFSHIFCKSLLSSQSSVAVQISKSDIKGLVKAKIGPQPKALALASCFLLPTPSAFFLPVLLLMRLFLCCLLASLSLLAACIFFSNALPLAVEWGWRILAPSCSPCLQVFSFFPFSEMVPWSRLIPWWCHDG